MSKFRSKFKKKAGGLLGSKNPGPSNTKGSKFKKKTKKKAW